MRRPFAFTVAILVGSSLVVVPPADGARASGRPGEEVRPITGSRSSSGGTGLGVSGVLPLHPDALARAKKESNDRAPGGDRLSAATVPAAQGWNGVFDPQVSPPDTTGAVGANGYIELVNLRYAIYSRSGGLVSSGPVENITGGTHACLSDPQIIWDADGQRFFFAILDACNDTFNVGFSRTPNPTGGGSSQWCRYTAFQYGPQLPDYPKLGDSGDFLLIGSNVFTNTGLSYVYDRSDVAWINKTDLFVDASGACNANVRSGVFTRLRDAFGAPASTPVPANGIEYDAPYGYVVAGPDAASQPNGVADHLSLFRVSADANGNAGLSAPRTVSVRGFRVPANARQPKTKKRLDTADARLTQAVAAFDPSENRIAVWTQHTTYGGAGAEVRWYEIAGDTGALLDSGTATSSSLFVFNGAISPDRSVIGIAGARYGGSMALTFNTSSRAAFSAVQYVTKPAGGSQSPFTKVTQSPGKNIDFTCTSVCRWGDYAGASPDPVAGTTGGTVWLANQWNVKSTTSIDVDWRTHVFTAGF